ncbi:MAG: alpha/beta hydrolase, partial [Chloroflexi bacterium]|nr:alpha/beta hydrolase [Chloroflexota bacterium]
MTATATQPTTRTLEVPGATLTYDVRPNESSTEPGLFLIGSPMGAGGFPTLAGYFTDRSVITYDPRGSERSTAHDPEAPIKPETMAEDLHAIVEAIGGPVDVFASSGGAVNALAWVAKYPHDVRTLVAHEPPLASLVPDREHALAANRAMHETYMRNGFGRAMAQFIAVISHRGPYTAELASTPPPDPAMFGMPTEDDGSRTDLMFAHQML